MKSIQTKFIILILSCVLLSSGVVGAAGVLNFQRTADASTAQMMNLMCTERQTQLDALLSRIEQSVSTLAVYSLEQLESVDRLKTDPDYMAEYTQQLEKVAINAASNTEGSMAVYVRFNPEFAPPTSGLFWSKTALNGSFQQLTPTDFSSYAPSDTEHVGWYYAPVKSGKALWMDPYLNKNINVMMISYVIPLYSHNEVVGVVGMDIDLGIITDIVREMKVYDSGYAFLTDKDGFVVSHRDIAIGTQLNVADPSLAPIIAELQNGSSGSNLFAYSRKDVPKLMAFRSLRNNMRFAITAPLGEINHERDQLVRQILLATLIIVSLSVTLTIAITRKLVRPLRELNVAAQKIANGDLSISLTQQTRDEVGMLSESFQQTVDHLQKYIEYINGLAYRDSLTGAKNKTAYMDVVKNIEERMRLGKPEFAVMVFDINGLKETNDRFGHDFGDMLIIEACKTICRVFHRSPVFRIGGDEFVAILENSDLENYSQLIQEFEQIMAESASNAHPENRVSIARGIAIYNPDTDLVFANVVKRADDAMYQNKRTTKDAPQANDE